MNHVVAFVLALMMAIFWSVLLVLITQRLRSPRGQIQAPNSYPPPTQNRPPTPPSAKKFAMAIDSTSPPSWKVYAPKGVGSIRTCTCHPERYLVSGQRVLWWPVPNSGGVVNVFCEEGIEVEQ